MNKPKRPYYVTQHKASGNTEYEIGWAKWVIMHHLLGYAVIDKTEIRRAYEILNREDTE